jgi:predicted MFS family arabinose efflux permease
MGDSMQARQRWWGLAALTIARASMGFQFQCIAAASPFIGDALGLDKAQLGWLIGLYLLPGIAVALPGGLLGARFGDKRLVLVGLGSMAIGGLWLSLAHGLADASAARIVGGIGAVMLNVLITKMVADAFDGKERLLAMSIVINSWPIGIGLALLVVGPLGQAVGWRAGIASAGAIALAGALLVAAVVRTPPRVAAPPRGLGLDAITRSEWPLLLVASLPWLLYNAAFQINMSFLPSLLIDSGLDVAGAGRIVALNAVMFVVGVQAGGVLLERAREPDRICHLGVLAWCATLLLLTTHTTPALWVLLGGLLGGLPAAAFVSLPAEVLRVPSRSAGMGVFYTVYYLGCAVLPSAAGRLYDHHGGGAALWMAAALALACVPVLWLLHRRTASVPLLR